MLGCDFKINPEIKFERENERQAFLPAIATPSWILTQQQYKAKNTRDLYIVSFTTIKSPKLEQQLWT